MPSEIGELSVVGVMNASLKNAVRWTHSLVRERDGRSALPTLPGDSNRAIRSPCRHPRGRGVDRRERYPAPLNGGSGALVVGHRPCR